jgi:5,6-dimethylbenzimidazole synthase
VAEYSVVAAIHTMWLAARAGGIGMGWVSVLTPGHINKVLDVAETWRLQDSCALVILNRKALL